MTSIQLPFTMIQDSVYRSPKRKREDDPIEPRLITSSLHHNLDGLIGDRRDTESPSTKVAGKFQKLGLQSPAEALNFSRLSTLDMDEALHSRSLPTKPGDMTTPNHNSSALQQITPPRSTSFSFEMHSGISLRQYGELPRSKSPAPSDIVSDQFWHRNEITGYSPDDPDEDDYGVNGVGYQKTPAVAYALSQKRKQQIAEYRNRETREARQRRGERRMNSRLSKSPTPSSSPKESQKSGRRITRIVRFSDG